MSKEKTLTAEEYIKSLLVLRGFSSETILNNRGLIGAVIEDMEQYANAKVKEAVIEAFRVGQECEYLNPEEANIYYENKYENK